jgi:hypothetical protein
MHLTRVEVQLDRHPLHWGRCMLYQAPTPAPASSIDQLLAVGIATQAPQLQALMDRLQLQAGIVEETELEDALHALHASTTALDFALLRPQGGGSFALRKVQAASATLSLQASRVRADAARVWACCTAVAAGSAARAAAAPRLLVRFGAAAMQLQQSVDLATVLIAQAPGGTAPEVHARLARLEAFCRQARRVHRLSSERTAGRLALRETVEQRVVRAGNELQDSLRGLLAAAGQGDVPPAAIAAALARRQDLQAGVVQACAEIIRLHDWDHQLGTGLASMAHKARLAA